jgi:hypothetical protein
MKIFSWARKCDDPCEDICGSFVDNVWLPM